MKTYIKTLVFDSVIDGKVCHSAQPRQEMVKGELYEDNKGRKLFIHHNYFGYNKKAWLVTEPFTGLKVMSCFDTKKEATEGVQKKLDREPMTSTFEKWQEFIFAQHERCCKAYGL